MTNALYQTDLPDLKLLQRGKVRDIYDMGEHLLMVASDRLSAFDVVMPNPVPEKGKVLTQISEFWFEMMAPLVQNHLVSNDVADYPAACQPYAEQLRGRSMLVKKAEPLAIECIVRGYISGSGWNSYKKDRSVCGIPLPDGLKESDKLPEPLFTPSTKAESGRHDINIDFDAAADLVGRDIAEKVKTLSLEIYRKGSDWAAGKGIIIADTKFEFGILDGEIILIDEVLTPDSSRFWPKDLYQPGGAQKSFDKQFVRDYLNGLDWDKNPPAPELPEEVIDGTRRRYLEALKQITGNDLDT
jgi:phosphoribosylaminoimidazole-succinocarboxamide synthase